jgi:hypothetical protein
MDITPRPDALLSPHVILWDEQWHFINDQLQILRPDKLPQVSGLQHGFFRRHPMGARDDNGVLGMTLTLRQAAHNLEFLYGYL